MHSNTTVKVSDITIGELKEVIAESVKEAMEDMMEDMQALASKNYISSIKEARTEYKTGKVKKLKEITDA